MNGNNLTSSFQNSGEKPHWNLSEQLLGVKSNYLSNESVILMERNLGHLSMIGLTREAKMRSEVREMLQLFFRKN